MASPLTLPSSSTPGSFLLLAGNASSDIFLAAEAINGNPAPVLTSTSTAIVLSRLAQGRLPLGTSPSQFSAVIQSTNEFAQLVTLVNAALQVATPPIDYPGVASSILTVLSQAKAKGFAIQNPKKNSNPLTSVKASVESPLPFYVVKDKSGFYTVKVTNPDSSVSGVKLKNGFLIYFGAFGETSQPSLPISSNLPIGPDRIRQAILPASQLLTVVTSDTEISIPGNGEVWNLTIRHTPYAQHLDQVEIISNTLSMLLSNFYFAGNDCISRALAETVVSSVEQEGFREVPVAVGRSLFEAHLTNLATFKKPTSALLKCATEKKIPELDGKYTETSFAESVVPFIKVSAKFAGRFVAVVLAAEKLYDATNLATKFAMHIGWWNHTDTFVVCHARSAVTRALEVSNCAVALQFNRQNVSLTLGGKYRYALTATDLHRRQTLLPENITFKSDKPSFVSVDETGVITGLKVTTQDEYATITAFNPATGARGESYVKVSAVSANLTLSPLSITLGSSATLSWTSNSATSCSIPGVPSALGTSGSVIVTPPSTGVITYRLSCEGPGGPAVSSATLTIVPPPTPVTVEILANPASITTAGSSTLTWTSRGATSCSASGSWSGTKATHGSIQISQNNAAVYPYVLSCVGPGGSAESTTNLTVTSPPPPQPPILCNENELSYYRVYFTAVNQSCMANFPIVSSGYILLGNVDNVLAIFTSFSLTLKSGYDSNCPTYPGENAYGPPGQNFILIRSASRQVDRQVCLYTVVHKVSNRAYAAQLDLIYDFTVLHGF